MCDGLKINKDKRHKSSSSLAGVCLDGTCSERKLDIRGSIPEVDDQFTLAESRCDDLQEKIDLVKVLRKKRKLKKKSTTRISTLAEHPIIAENVHTPFISVRTQPKKKVSQQSTRVRRLEVPPNPTRGYLDPATIEQHRMLGQVWGYSPHYKQYDQIQNNEYSTEQQKSYPKTRARRARADGDAALCGQGVQITSEAPMEVACGQEDMPEYSDPEIFDNEADDFMNMESSRNVERTRSKPLPSKRRNASLYSRENSIREVPKWIEPMSLDSTRAATRGSTVSQRHRPAMLTRAQPELNKVAAQKPVVSQEDRPVVELFNKNRFTAQPLPNAPRLQKKDTEKRSKKQARDLQKIPDDQATGPSEEIIKVPKKESHHPRRVKYRSRGYELPTVASQMKQADVRYRDYFANRTNIPFVVSKSTAPSHNIGVNIQQVLNGLKIQQPLSGIPLTIAHHMGLGHIPTYGTKSVTTQPSLDNREINAIKLGRRLLLLPSYKYNMSYNRLLTLYREGDGMVPRFLRAISRPHYFYTSMYNLATNRDDLDAATSKGRAGNDTRHQLSEYAGLYHEYERVEKRLKEAGHSVELERRRDELLRELTVREEVIKKLVQDPSLAPGDFNLTSLRASASAAEEGYRHSTFKLNSGDQP